MKEVCKNESNTNHGIFSFDDICSLNTFRDNFVQKINSQVNNNTELNQLREQINMLQKERNNNNSNQNRPTLSTHKEKSLPEKFAFWLFDIQYGKLLVNQHHINIFKTHLSQETCTPTLLWSNFPEPLLPFDTYYMEGYNKIILAFQKSALDLGIECCEKRVIENTNTINSYKDKYINTEQLDEKLLSIKMKKEKNLKTKFDSDNERVLRYTRQIMRALNKEDHVNKSNTLTQTQYRRNASSTPNNHNKSNSFSTERNKRNKRRRTNSSSFKNSQHQHNNNNSQLNNSRNSNYQRQIRNNNYNNRKKQNNNQNINFQQANSFNEHI